MNADVERKLPDARLRSFVLEGSERKVSVLVQVEWPAAKLTGGAREPRRPGRLTIPDPDAEAEAERQAQRLGAWLEELLDEPPVWLRSAHAFAVQATGLQIARIAEAAMTRAIEPNRRFP